MPAKRSQTTSQLRLKNHHQCDSEENRETSHDPSNHHQVQQRGDQRQGQKNDGQPSQYFRAAGSAEVEIAVIDRDPQQKDLHQATPASEPEIYKLMNHFVL